MHRLISLSVYRVILYSFYHFSKDSNLDMMMTGPRCWAYCFWEVSTRQRHRRHSTTRLASSSSWLLSSSAIVSWSMCLASHLTICRLFICIVMSTQMIETRAIYWNPFLVTRTVKVDLVRLRLSFLWDSLRAKGVTFFIVRRKIFLIAPSIHTANNQLMRGELPRRYCQ